MKLYYFNDVENVVCPIFKRILPSINILKELTNRTKISFPVPDGTPVVVSAWDAEVELIVRLIIGLYSIALSLVSKSNFRKAELKLT